MISKPVPATGRQKLSAPAIRYLFVALGGLWFLIGLVVAGWCTAAKGEAAPLPELRYKLPPGKSLTYSYNVPPITAGGSTWQLETRGAIRLDYTANTFRRVAAFTEPQTGVVVPVGWSPLGCLDRSRRLMCNQSAGGIWINHGDCYQWPTTFAVSKKWLILNNHGCGPAYKKWVQVETSVISKVDGLPGRSWQGVGPRAVEGGVHVWKLTDTTASYWGQSRASCSRTCALALSGDTALVGYRTGGAPVYSQLIDLAATPDPATLLLPFRTGTGTPDPPDPGPRYEWGSIWSDATGSGFTLELVGVPTPGGTPWPTTVATGPAVSTASPTRTPTTIHRSPTPCSDAAAPYGMADHYGNCVNCRGQIVGVQPCIRKTPTRLPATKTPAVTTTAVIPPVTRSFSPGVTVTATSRFTPGCPTRECVTVTASRTPAPAVTGTPTRTPALIPTRTGTACVRQVLWWQNTCTPTPTP